jgi:hypothetical protein
VLGVTLCLLRERRAAIFTGLGAKCVEFAVSYGATGATSTYVMRALGS